MERLDKFLANAKVGTRSEVKKIIKAGVVKVNGKTIKKPEFKVSENDEITVNNKKIIPHKNIYIIINKPKGYLSATYDKKDKYVLQLINHPYKNELKIAGRLDKDAHGLLILTNDGEYIHKIISPKKDIYKTYEVIVKGEITEEKLEKLKKGIKLKDFTTKPAIIEKVENQKITIKISEGKFHQVKRMMKAVGLEVIDLKRIAIGNITLPENLNDGEWIELINNKI
ncbi:RNA-binding protein S4 [Marinitoga sp. 1135]|uniref:Pseudouridine synthase n=1 Tax=Marinitoga piezophila (strain DSM 14283 / JCM 11233 / KA3) TaxID=443254 RepID=H2J5I2_MARPK|nr:MULTISPECIES: pseudouridine synthase [Marinitoga]AEX86126.1 pseudouridine synthase family protein [Marinitoga piezophila KA3]APT76541.1 RNA-binding protein S4 [Marinitoga sp. 1137]NUU96310.1 RNA-binding protein S4 [Marinitoga sp. 1135]NUU98228.1 RNA-binding protein S4 [Marinitoga sp. 1138]